MFIVLILLLDQQRTDTDHTTKIISR